MKHLKKKNWTKSYIQKKNPVAFCGSKVQHSDEINGAPLETL